MSRNHPDQTNMFDADTRVRPTDPSTSHDAAERIMPKLNQLQLTVLDYFRSIYPAVITDLDLQEHFGNHLSTYRTRRQELTALGLIQDSGRQKWQRGSNRIMWGAAPWK